VAPIATAAYRDFQSGMHRPTNELTNQKPGQSDLLYWSNPPKTSERE